MKQHTLPALTVFQELTEHLDALPENQESLQRLRIFVRKVVHDFNTPVGVFALDLFSLQYLVQMARQVPQHELNGVLKKISEIGRNLMAAESTARRLIDGLDRLSDELPPPNGP